MMYIFVLILGICIGSFLNVLIDRLAREESVVKGRSYCEDCCHKLSFLDLIPVVSFAILKGKCRYCRSPISFYYPVVELMTGILFALVFSNFQFSIFNFQSNQNFQYQAPNISLSGITNIGIYLQLLFILFIVCSLVVIFFTDLKYGIIPDKIVFPSITISLFYFFIIHNSLFINHLLSAIGAFMFFLAIFLFTKGKGMGFGDVKLAFLMGLFLGFPKIIIAVYIAFLTGAIISLILILWKKKKIKDAVPFGPFLVFGTILLLFFGEQIQNLLQAVLHL